MRHPLQWLAGKTGIPHGELRWAAWFAAVLMAATCLPYLFGIGVTPPGSRYMGFLSNPDEHNVYMGWMRQAMEGRWLFKDPFTTEPQPGPGFFNAFFLALGLIARVLHVEPIWPYHAGRLAFGFLLLLTGYLFAARFCESVLARRLALGLAGLSSGFGWLYALLRPASPVHPIDFGAHLVLPEAITFLSLLLNPLFAASVWLILVTYLFLLRAWETGSRKALAGACIAALILANIHTYDALVVYAVLLAYLLVKAISERRLPWRETGMAAAVVAVSACPVIYQYVFFRADFVFQTKALTLTLTPPGRYVALGFGLPLLLAIPGGAVALRERRLLFPLVWAVTNWLLVAYAPFSFQRKMIEAMQIPICILAAAFVGDWWLRRGGPLWPPTRSASSPMGVTPSVARSPGFRDSSPPARNDRPAGRWAAAIAVALVALTIPSNAFFLQRAAHNLLTNNRDLVGVLMPPLHLTHDEYAAMLWLRRNSQPTDVVLSTNLTGSYLPGVSGNTVFVGHWAETIHFRRKLGALQDFFDPSASDAFRIELARRNHLRYLFYGPYERAVGAFDPARSPLLRPVYHRGDVTILRFELAPT